jgi:hypothetical protein
MQIFYHAASTIANQMAIEGDRSSLIKIALENASTAPYVLDPQMLALSALRYSTIAGASRHLYIQQATELQTRAPIRFNEARGQAGPNVGICSLLFVSLLGIHLLHDTVAVHHNSIGDVVSKFVAYMRTHCGVRGVASLHWPDFRQSGLYPLLTLTQWIGNSDVSHDGEETPDLRALLESSPDSSTTCIQACFEALGWAQWALNLRATVPENSSKRVHATMTWPVMVCRDCVEALHQRRPDALAVLSFFATSLYQPLYICRFASAGPRLVQSIVMHVGPYWAGLLP